MSERENNPPKYWSTFEEKNGDPEVERLRSEEFFEKPAEILNEAGEVNFTLTRRNLLKLSGAAMALAAVGCARRPVEKIIPYVVAPEEITPGLATWYASTCAGCAAGCGVLVKTREGRPIKLEGNPKHPINHGRLCARGQATVLDLYDPDRLQQPIKYGRGKQTPENLTLAQADEIIVDTIKKNRSVVLVTPSINGLAARRAQREFLTAYPNVKLVTYDVLGDDDLIRAQEICYGTAAKPRYRFEQANYFLMLGADPFGASSSPVEAAYGYGQARKPDKDGMAKLVVFEPAITLTGGSADERFLIEPQYLAAVGFALANALMQAGLGLFEKSEDNQKLRAKLAQFAPEKIEKQAGLSDGLIKRIAKELQKYRGKSLVIGGSTAVQNHNSLQLQIAVNILNSMLGNEGKTVDGAFVYSKQRTGLSDSLRSLENDLQNGNVDAVIFAGTNPVYSYFNLTSFKAATVITLSDRIDETAKLSDYVFPLSHGLESWNDHEPQNGIFAVRQPAITPLYTTRSLEEYYLNWSAAKSKFSKPPVILEFIQETWKQTFMKDASQRAFLDWWDDRLREGVFSTVNPDGAIKTRAFIDSAHIRPRKSGTPEIKDESAIALIPDTTESKPGKSDNRLMSDIDPLQFITTHEVETSELQLVLQTNSLSHNGSQRNNAWLLETPDPISKISWDNVLAMAPSTAKRLGYSTGDLVRINVDKTTLDVPINIQPGVHPKVLALALGWGRTSVGRIGNNVGVNGFKLARAISLPNGQKKRILSSIPVTLTKTTETRKLANMQGHNYLEGRPIVQETTFDKWRENPASGGRGPREFESIWGAPPPNLNPASGEPVRWWMTIDINSCIGCNACAVACQAENNVAVVGKEQVLRGREMSWIRIDRYYSGDDDNPELVYSPMLCQQCSHAPCETVCPVVATTHNDEGINVQTYNRCVGTRYCSNNCPYKVRRFNWLADNTQYSQRNIQHPMEMVLNPDVTVRSIGVMEKCNFCLQRVREGHEYRKANGLTAIPDEMVKPACAQTCPTQAISFGNILNKSSKVAEKAKDPRGYQVLDEVNTRPAIIYLRKLRNRMPKSWDNSEHEANNNKHEA